MPQQNPLPEHDHLVLVLARWLERNDYLVAADLEDHTKPPTLGAYTPDVYGKQATSRVIGEAELCERLRDEQTQSRWKAFSAVVSQPASHPAYELHIIVPSSCFDEAHRQAAVWGITATFHSEKLADQPGLSQ